MGASFTHKWIPRIEQQEKNLFVEEYYSSTDTQIKIDDEEQTEIGYINYTVQEQLKPLYGYASRTFDDIAVGNRIVTGMFKVPIKNPEIQTPLEHIVSSQNYKNGDYSSYNDQQEELQNAIEWITRNNNEYSGSELYEYDDEIFTYSEKLNALGFKYDDASNPVQSITQQIKDFQTEYKCDEVNGLLTEQTKQVIDEAIKKSNLETINLPAGTKIYNGPSSTHDIITILETEQTVYVIDAAYDDGWTHIMLTDNTEGYVNINKT